MTFVSKKTVFIAFALAAAFAVSCKSAPPAGKPQDLSKVTKEDAQKAREDALAAQKEALDAKADKAARDEYALSLDQFKKGDTASAAKNWREARAQFDGAASGFRGAAQLTADKRRLAALAYREAAETRAEVRRKAVETETAEQAAGIEAGEDDAAAEE